MDMHRRNAIHLFRYLPRTRSNLSFGNCCRLLLISVVLLGTLLFYVKESNGYDQRSDPCENGKNIDKTCTVEFILHKRENSGYITYGNDVSLQNYKYDPTKPVKIIVHGWSTKTRADFFNSLQIEAFLKFHNMNVIVVDWKYGSSLTYKEAVKRVKNVGLKIAQLIDWLIENGTPDKLFHLIGYNLGAKAVEIASRSVNKGKISYITALDPVKSLWGDESERVRKEDAANFEIFDTYAGLYGIKEQIGDNDFQLNKEENFIGLQPGYLFRSVECTRVELEERSGGSINYNDYMAVQCRDYEKMNENSEVMLLGRCYPIPVYFVSYLATCEKEFNVNRDVEFILHTREGSAKIIKGDINSLQAAHFDKTKPVKIITHGWRCHKNSSVNTLITDAFLTEKDVNVIVVDWKKGAGSLFYPKTCGNVHKVGPYIAELLDWLIEYGTPAKSFHLIGHSLGAHIMGVAGRSLTNGTIPYITALDPAKPRWGSGSKRIRFSDAKYVEVIHTDAEVFGLKDPVGHNDFYPNKGGLQPGCFLSMPGCSHSKSYEYFADSIDHDGFMAVQCKNYDEMLSGKCANLSKLHMGGSSPKKAVGVFYLETNEKKPYYKGDY